MEWVSLADPNEKHVDSRCPVFSVSSLCLLPSHRKLVNTEDEYSGHLQAVHRTEGYFRLMLSENLSDERLNEKQYHDDSYHRSQIN